MIKDKIYIVKYFDKVIVSMSYPKKVGNYWSLSIDSIELEKDDLSKYGLIADFKNDNEIIENPTNDLILERLERKEKLKNLLKKFIKDTEEIIGDSDCFKRIDFSIEHPDWPNSDLSINAIYKDNTKDFII